MTIYETPVGKMKVAKLSERGTVRLVIHNSQTIGELNTRAASGSILCVPRELGESFRAPSMAAACEALAGRMEPRASRH